MTKKAKHLSTFEQVRVLIEGFVADGIQVTHIRVPSTALLESDLVFEQTQDTGDDATARFLGVPVYLDDTLPLGAYKLGLV